MSPSSAIRRRRWLACFVVFAATGCAADDGQLLREQLRRGDAGYVGAIRPLDSPVEVTLGPVRSFKGEARNFIRQYDGTENSSFSAFSGEIREHDGKFLWTLRLERIAKNSSTWAPAQPIFEMEFWLEKNGIPIGKPSFKFPAFEEAGRAPPAKEVDQVRDEMKRQLALMRAVPRVYSSGTDLFPPNVIQSLTQQIFKGYRIDKNTIACRATGITIKFGRPDLFSRCSGIATAQSGSDEARLTFAGHYVMDVGTGLTTSGLIRVVASKVVDGKPAQAEGIGVWKLTSADFLDLPKATRRDASAPVEHESRPIAFEWQGVNPLVAGNVAIARQSGGGTISLTLPADEGTCQGAYSTALGQRGTWSLACTNGLTASGEMHAYGPGKGSYGDGRDSWGRIVRFTVGGR